MGGIVLGPYPRKLLAENATIDDKGSGFTGINISYNPKSKNEVDEVLKQVEQFGAKIIKPVQKAFLGWL